LTSGSGVVRSPISTANSREWLTPATVLAAVLLSMILGCRSVYFVEIADSSSVPRQIEHCLSSLGLTDRSSQPKEAEQIARDPKLAAVWASQHHESRWYLAATAFVERDGALWKLRFIPGPPGSEDSVVVFAEGFSGCVTLHDPEIHIDVTASRRLDLW
jgi:hypothetical protein